MAQTPFEVAAPRALAERGVQRIVPFRVRLSRRFRGVETREGLLLHGPAGWGEWAPFPEYGDDRAVRWLAAAVEAACEGFPAAERDEVEVNAILPEPDPELAESLAAQGFSTFKCKVGGDPETDVPGILAVAAAVARRGVQGRFRLDANERYAVADAVAVWAALSAELGDRLDYFEQPCATAEELRAVRAAGVRVAADELLRNSDLRNLGGRVDQLRASADVLILKAAPLGGVRRALEIAEKVGLPCVVSGAMDTSIGLESGLALARSLPAELVGGACGLGTGHLLAEDITSVTTLPAGGRLGGSAPPEPDEELLDVRARAAADSIGWWAERLGRCVEALGDEGR